MFAVVAPAVVADPGKPAGNHARFARPNGVAVDAAGNVYVADGDNHTIRKITPAGAVTTLAGSPQNWGHSDGAGTAAVFDTPKAIAVDATGNVYVADATAATISKITPDGTVTTLAGSPASPGYADGPGLSAQFHFPTGVSVDSAGDVYVADALNYAIRKITPAGEVSTFAGSPGKKGGRDGTGTAAMFQIPTDVALDSAGNIYVPDFGNQTIRKITPAGAVSTLAGSPGQTGAKDGAGSAAEFSKPMGAAVDAAGNVYVADSDNDTIRKITPAGVVSTLAGSPGKKGSQDGVGSAAGFSNPIAAAVDSAGNLYVADSLNFTIRKITPAGVVSTFAGSPGQAGSADSVVAP